MNTLHEIYGHIGEEATKWTADHYGHKCQGSLDPCESCALAKARQRNLNRVAIKEQNGTPGERLCFDISSVKTKSIGGRKYWLLIVDEATDMCWSYFMRSKDETGKTYVK